MNKIEAVIQGLTFIHLIILALGAYSITRLIVTDSLFDKQRAWIFDRFPPTGHVSKSKPPRGLSIHASQGYYTNKGTFLGELLSCPWCFSFWVSVPVAAAYVAVPYVALLVLLPFALRATVGVIAFHNGG